MSPFRDAALDWGTGRFTTGTALENPPKSDSFCYEGIELGSVTLKINNQQRESTMLATSSNGGAATPQLVAQTPGGAGAAATPATAPRRSDDGAGPLRIPFRSLQRRRFDGRRTRGEYCGECCWEEAVCATAATTKRLHACACEGADENSWQSRPRHACALGAGLLLGTVRRPTDRAPEPGRQKKADAAHA